MAAKIIGEEIQAETSTDRNAETYMMGWPVDATAWPVDATECAGWNMNWVWYCPSHDYSLRSPSSKKSYNNVTRKQKRPVKTFEEAEILAKRQYCTVHKHARLGCAIVKFESIEMQEYVLGFLKYNSNGEAKWIIGTHPVSIRRHFDGHTNDFDHTSIFVHWGHQMEKLAPLPVSVVADHFNLIAREVKISCECGSVPPRADEVPTSRFGMGFDMSEMTSQFDDVSCDAGEVTSEFDLKWNMGDGASGSTSNLSWNTGDGASGSTSNLSWNMGDAASGSTSNCDVAEVAYGSDSSSHGGEVTEL
eukprot:TRINITY_DN20730_c0_g1_i1.p2 TRINITY_DN20730_c0_g1~~TRINITY_DN20730_c0_g1_i1.p2  ORF type:complete len:327 (-),score=64.93 TRINITY_DN20730_c0_g1_i1:262-1173(-)